MTPEERRIEIASRKQSQGVHHRLWCKEAWQPFEVFRVPVNALALNVENKRFAAERNLVEEKLGRALDPETHEVDEESLVSILCDNSLEVDLVEGKAYGKPSKDYEALRDDWLQRKQAEPLWIRPDGTVHNGNRRLAMLKRLRSEGTVTDWVDVIILDPSQIDDTELFRMEQREQLAENFKKRYADINALLALREAAEQENIDWADPRSLETVANILKHFAGKDDRRYALVQLGAIRAIDAYLDFIGVPGAYHLVRRQVEVFREVGKCMALLEEYPDEADELVAASFAFAQSGRTYLDIRQLRDMFLNDRARFERLYGRIAEAEEQAGWSGESPTDAGTDAPDLDVLTAPDDDDDLPDPDTVSPSGYPKEDVSRAILDGLDEYNASTLEIAAQLSQSLARLEGIDLDRLVSDIQAGNEKVRSLTERVIEWAENTRSALGQ
ncbi:hypothetical protein [Pseudonocardia alni]|uniref:hypothetical protein n=1 Tax=Pseudonocardia alni TaxID=33907 RepID=UPI003329B5B9